MVKNKSKDKGEDKPSKKSRTLTFSEFNPCRPRAKGRPSERVFIVEELINAKGRNFKDCYEAAATKWAKAASRDGVKGSVEELATLYKSNIPGSRSNIDLILNIAVDAIAKKFSRKATYEMDDDGDITFKVGGEVKASKATKTATKTKAPAKGKVTASSKDESDEDEDTDESDDEDDDED